MSAIVVERLRKEYGKVVAVEDVSFTVPRGKLIGLVGHNGAGKSTTLRMLTGQLAPTAGTVSIAGVDATRDPNGARARMGIVPEDPRLYEYLTAREMLEFVVATRGTGDVDEGLRIAGLGADADRLISEYSQGMRRKTALACAMVSRPEVLLLDEALNGLDPPSALRITDELQAATRGGTAILLSTHVLDTLERIADGIVMLSRGRVILEAPGTAMDKVRRAFGELDDGK